MPSCIFDILAPIASINSSAIERACPKELTPSASISSVHLILIVLLGGLFIGVGVAYLMHQLRPVFTSARQLTELTQLPVLGVVSMTWLERHKASERRALWVYSAATAVLLLMAIVMLLTQNLTSQLLHGVMA